METTEKSSNFAMPEEVGSEICRVLGLAINNILVYGMQHSVTATSVTTAYDELLGKLDGYGEIEFVISDTGLLINGTAIQTERTTGQIFSVQLHKLGVHDFALKSPLDRTEFSKFMSILSAAPGSELVVNGFEAAISKAQFKCIRVTNISYARIDKNADLEKMNFEEPVDTPETGGEKTGGGAKSFDLDMGGGTNTFDLDMGGGANAFDLDMGMNIGEMSYEDTPSATYKDITADAMSYLKEKRSADDLEQKLVQKIKNIGSQPEDLKEMREQMLAAGLSQNEWNDLLLESGILKPERSAETDAAETLKRIRAEVDALVEHGETIATGKSGDAMSGILETIGLDIARLSAQTNQHATTLVGKVDADREMIAQVEKDARDSGIGLNLSRDELLESLAEINQEMAQSLTVVSSVTDILTSENIGAINPAQQDILKVATDGMERINKLVAYLGNLSGVPESLTPDRKITDEAYGK